MLDVLDDLIRRHRHTGVLVDANLLMVFLLATWDEDAALKFKRTKGYTSDDLVLVQTVLREFDHCIVTPSVLAEVSNLTDSLLEPGRTEFFLYLSGVLDTAAFEERCPALSSVLKAKGFVRLGFTDASIEELGRAGAPVLTEDVPLYVLLSEQQIEVFNMTHVRFMSEP
jgi:hypothetical protein